MNPRFFRAISLVLMVTMLLAPFTAGASAAPPAQGEPPQDKAGGQPNCALLDDPAKRARMSGAFETKLLIDCGRADELGQVMPAGPAAPFRPDDLGPDVLVNDPTGEQPTASQYTQSETSLARNDDSSVICSTYNDAYDGLVAGLGFTGYSSSTDKGATWVDHGGIDPVSNAARGDPATVYSRRDDTFYEASLHTNGLGLWDLGSGCDDSTFVGMIHTGGGDDKELMAVDNNPSSPYYGRLYVAWTDFNVGGGQIHVTYSDDGTTWSTPVAASDSFVDVQGAWPVVDPVANDLYVAWVRWNPYSAGPIDIEIVRSTDGGDTFSFVANPITGQVNPYDNAATSSCGRPALNGNIRYLPSPQIVVDRNRNLHVVYSYDPDGNGTGDVVNVYYRRSTDQGATWGPEIQLNDDVTLTDQWFPALAVNDNGVVGTFWYDRRDDPANNYQFYYYKAVSHDNGLTFQPNERVSDVPSNVILDSALATCYHGDYDTSIADVTRFYVQWSDDRPAGPVNQEDPNIWLDTEWIMTEVGTLAGEVYEATYGPALQAPIADADVRATLNVTYSFNTSTDASGMYSMMVMSGTYDVTASKYGYLANTISGVSVVSGTTTTQDIALTPAAMYVVDGLVTDSATGDPLWATIDISGDPYSPPTTTIETDPVTGYYSITLAEGITYTFDVGALLHVPTSTVLAPLTGDTTLNISLDATTQEGLIAGWVRNYYTDDPIEGAIVDVEGGPSATTDADGYFETATMPAGFYTATASADLYSSVTITDIEVVTSNVALVTFRLPTPRLEIAPLVLEETLALGTVITNPGQLVITNTGIGDLDWEISERPGGFAPAVAPLAGEDVLLVYDSGPSARDAFELALTNLGYTYLEVTSSVFTGMTLAELLEYKAIIYVGYPSAGTEQDQCIAYLDAGGSLLVSDNDFGWYQGSSVLYQTYFQATYVSDSGSDGVITGMDIMVGIDVDISADPYPDDFIGGAEGVGIFQAPSGNLAGIRAERADYRAIYFAWDYHYAGGSAVGDPVETTILDVALGWLIRPLDVPWIAEQPVSGTLSLNETQPITIGWHADGPEIDQPGEYYASLSVENNDPLAQDLQVPVTMTVTPPPSWGKLNGMVTSTGYCDINPYAVGGAKVVLEGSLGYTYTLWTGDDDMGWPDGYYERWLDVAESPYTVSVSYSEHPTTTIVVSITAGVTQTEDFILRWQQPCVDVTPDSISETLGMGQVFTVPMSIGNTGAVALDFALQEKDGGYVPAVSAYSLLAPLALDDVDGANILLDESHGGSALTYEELTADLRAAGATVDVITVGPIDTALLSNYDVYWVPDSTSAAWTTDELDDIEAWVRGGGGLFINYDCCNDATAPVVAALFDIIYLGYGGGTGGVTSDIYPHPTTEGVTEIYLPSPYQSLAVVGTAEVVVNDVGGAPQVAVNDVGGRVVVVDDDAFNDGTYYNSNDNVLFAADIFDWLVGAADVVWISEDPITGTVAADGGLAAVDVVLDAGQVFQPGTYYATLRARSNDPVMDVVDVPVSMTIGPPPTWGKLEGTVTGLGHCDVNPAVLEEAVVLIEDGTTVSVTTDVGGVYLIWLDAGTYTVTASFADHVSDQAVVVISGGETTVADLYLRSIEPCVSVTPLSMTSTLLLGDSEVQMLRITNDGAGDTSFQFGEILGTPLTATMRSPISIPASDGDFPRNPASVSIGRAPESAGAVAEPFALFVNPGPPAYGVDLFSDSLYYWDDVDVPGTWTLVGAPGIYDLYAGDFAGSDLGQIYIISNLALQLYSVDTSTAASTLIGACTPNPGQTWTGMSWDSTTGVMYASATDGITATLFTVDLSTGATTEVGTITGGAYTIDIAVDASGQMYGLLIDTDSLVAIDKTTGTATTIGSLVFDANHAQGLDFDEESGTLYWAAYGVSGELRIIDPSTGASTSVGGFPGGAEVDAFAIATGGGGVAVPWLDEDPITGTVSADSFYDVDITFTALPTMTSGVHTATLVVGTDDAVNGSINVPVTLTIIAAPYCGFTSSSPDDVGETTYFTNTTVGDPPMTYRWDFGDGSPISAAENPTHDYGEVGWYTVVLTAENPWGMDVCTGTVAIQGPPSASFESNSPVILGEPMVFTDTSIANPAAMVWFWQFGSGQGSSTDQHPVYTYTAAGDYVVTLIVTNIRGGDDYVDTVTVDMDCVEIVGADFSHVEDPALVVRFEGIVTPGTATTPITYTWDFGDGSLDEGEIVTHTYALSSTVSYTVTMTAANACPSQSTVQKRITLWPLTVHLPVVMRNY